MAKSVKDLVASIMGPRDGALPGIQAFPPLDLDQLAKEVRLDERAEQAGRAGQPLPDSEGPDRAELDVLDQIERLARKAHEVYITQLDLYEGRIRRAVITADLRVQIEAAGSNALADLKAEIIHDQNQLNTLLQAVGDREQEFREFRGRHGLTRLPRNPSPEEQTLAVLLLLVFVLLESILNGMFFAEGSEAGLIGGVVQALVLSILNVGVAALYALYGFPYLFHRRRSGKAIGAIATLVFVLWLLGLNLAIGHFRDLFIAGAGSVLMADLLTRLTTAPLLLSDAKSLILVLLGVGLAPGVGRHRHSAGRLRPLLRAAAAQIQNHLARLRDSVPRFGLVEVYTVDRLGRRVSEPVFHLCNPGTGDDLSRIYQNPELARKRWNGFADMLAADIDQQVSLPATGTSPIFEAIQASAVRTFGRPEYDRLPKRLVIVSDLLQNVPGGLSMYEGVPSFRAFRKTDYFSQVRADLSGVSVAIYYLARSGVRIQGRRHLGFWDAYFRFQGARVESAVGVFGDK